MFWLLLGKRKRNKKIICENFLRKTCHWSCVVLWRHHFNPSTVSLDTTFHIDKLISRFCDCCLFLRQIQFALIIIFEWSWNKQLKMTISLMPWQWQWQYTNSNRAIPYQLIQFIYREIVVNKKTKLMRQLKLLCVYTDSIWWHGACHEIDAIFNFILKTW